MDYREELREDFWFSCAYCSIAESEAAGIGFQIDHYLPRRYHPELSSTYSNLMWSCQPCNGNKSASPTDDELAHGLEVLRPDKHIFRDHIHCEGATVVGRTRAGEWTVRLLSLNRGPLLKPRRIRERLGYARDLVAGGLRTLARARIDGIPPSDRPAFLRTRKALEDCGNEIEHELRSALREQLASTLLDKDEPEIARARKQELARLRSTIVDRPRR